LAQAGHERLRFGLFFWRHDQDAGLGLRICNDGLRLRLRICNDGLGLRLRLRLRICNDGLRLRLRLRLRLCNDGLGLRLRLRLRICNDGLGLGLGLGLCDCGVRLEWLFFRLQLFLWVLNGVYVGLVDGGHIYGHRR
jgi:hypothetical protein